MGWGSAAILLPAQSYLIVIGNKYKLHFYYLSEIVELRAHIRKLYLDTKRSQLQDYMKEILVVFSLVDVYHSTQLSPVRVVAAGSSSTSVGKQT